MRAILYVADILSFAGYTNKYPRLLTRSMLGLLLLAVETGNPAITLANPLPTHFTSQAVQKLVLGEPVEREIAGDDAHRYQLTPAAGEYLNIVVDQRSVAVVSAIIASSGQRLIEADNAGRESLSVIAAADAGQILDYTVEVRPRQRNAPGGRYTIRIEQQRAARPRDINRVAAEKLMWDGARLSRQQQRESLRLAVEKYRAALPLWQALEDRREEARTFYLLALVEQDCGENQAALESYLQSLGLSRAEGDRERESLALSALGTLYFALGDNAKAIDCYNQALSLSQTQANHELETSLLANLGVAYEALGESARALNFYQRALLQARALGDQAMEAALLTNQARLCDLFGDKQNSIAANQQVLPIWGAPGKLEVATLKNLGTQAESEGRLPEALDYFNQALALSQKHGDALLEAHIRGNLAHVNQVAGSFNDSRAQIEQTLMIIESARRQLLDPDLRSSFTAANRRYYEFYVDLLMQMQLRASNEKAGKSTGKSNERPAQNYAAEALRISESAHARALSDMIAEARIDITQGVDASLLRRERTLAQALTARKAERGARIRKNASIAEVELLDREVSALNAVYEQAKAEIKHASPQYAALVYPKPVGLSEIQRRLLDRKTLLLEYGLGEERSYLWVVSHNGLRGFTLPGRAVIEEQARRFYGRLTARSEMVKFEKTEQKQARIAQADGDLQCAAAMLSQTLLGQAASLLGQKRLLVVGDGMLNHIPFGALPEPGTKRQMDRKTGKQRDNRKAIKSSLPLQPLLVNHEVVNLPSATVLAELRREIPNRRRPTSELAVLADPVFSQNDARLSANRHTSSLSNPADSDAANVNQALLDPASLPSLPSLVDARAVTLRADGERDAQNLSRLFASRQEAERIARVAPDSRTLLALDFQANRDLVISGALGHYRLLHFATHGLLNSQTPELSGLVFSLVDEKGQPRPGVLRLDDIYNLKLAADLVVLSACRTGFGKEVRGEGAISLARGFMSAGVPRVISSLWAVDDAATAELMTHFYREMLTGGKTAAAALRAAQLALCKEKKWQMPYFWAGFTLQGEPK